MPDVDLQQLAQFVDWGRVPVAILIVLVCWILQLLLARAIDDLGERFAERRLFFKKTKALSRFILYAVALLGAGAYVLVFTPDTVVAVVAAGSIVIGFAFQDLMASLVAGVILLLDEPFQVGDRVSFQSYYGEITEIGLRSVRLVTLDDNLVTIPNNAFLSQAVASANAGELDCMVVIDFYIGAAENFYEARKIVAEAAATSPYVYLDKKVITLLSDVFLGERFITIIKVKAYVFDARFEKAFASDVTERVKRALRAAGIRGPDQQYRDLDMFDQETAPDRL